MIEIKHLTKSFQTPRGKITVLKDFSLTALNGTFLGIECDIDLARKIFSRIIETHPNIDDETAIKYFVKALNDIRDKEVSDERQESRAKRLSLNPDFRRWKH